MSWVEPVDRYGSLIEDKLVAYFNEAKRGAQAYHPFTGEVYSTLEEFVLRRGKRLASCSTLLIYEGYSGVVDERILTVGVAIELFRHSILVHDDLVDNDTIRRGGKSLHRYFTENYNVRVGNGTAVFAGNLMYSLAQHILHNAGFTQEKTSQAMLLLSEGYCHVNESQMLDLLFESKEPDIAEWVVMTSKRAASLFKTALLIGAIFSDAPKAELKVLEDAAVHLGYCFDIQDDIIDTFASLEQYGRLPGGDIIRGKKPLHLLYALLLLKNDRLQKLRAMIGQSPLLPEDLDWIREVLRDSAALDAAKSESQKHAEQAKLLFTKTSLSTEIKQVLSSLTTYIIESLAWYQ